MHKLLMHHITTKESIYKLLEQVFDPEVPVLTILDLGIVRDVILGKEVLEIVITPTYSGCPAMDMIEVNIKAVLQENGFEKIKIKTILSPAWTTDWLSEDGKRKLLEYGIVPPMGPSKSKRALFASADAIQCPRCNSAKTEMLSQFGSTACKAQYRCNECLEPFDYFKCH